MNEPRRLSEGGGASQRLLDSASIDKPSAAARRRAMLAATASSFSSTQSHRSTPRAPRRSTAKTFAAWMLIGAAASALIAVAASKVVDSNTARNAAGQSVPAMSVLPELAPPPPRAMPGIASEPPSPRQLTQLTPEAMALRIEELSKSGKTAEASALAAEFLRKYPEHPLAERVRAALGK